MRTKKSAVKTLIKLLALVKPLSGFMCLAVLSGAIACLAVQFIPVLGALGVLKYISPSENAQGGLTGLLSVKAIFILLVVFALVRSVFRYTEQKTNHYIAFTLLAIVRDKVFKALRKLCPAKLEGRDKGDLISLITSDVELLEVFYAHTISPICIAFVVELIMCLFIAQYSLWQALLALAAFAGVGVLLPFIISKISGDTGDKIRSEAADLSAYVLENIRGLDETLQYGNGKERLDGMNKRTSELSASQSRLNRLTGTNLAIANTFILIFDLLMTALSVKLWLDGTVSLEGFIIPVVALMSSFGPVVALSALGTTLQNTIASGNRILQVLEEEPETRDISGKDNISFSGAVVNEVTFAYKKPGSEEKVLDKVNMNFAENKIIGIVGKSGCGKSTLLKLLMRFWKTDSGEINISGKNIEEINTSNLREMESYMTQSTEIFKDTIAENIRIARLDATDEEIIEASKKASLDAFVRTLPEGYQTEVGDLGDTLSGGEKQRIALARAFLHKAPFILLDEPTSNLDSLNEAVILKALKQETEGKTVLLVSHRESTVKLCDEVIKMN